MDTVKFLREIYKTLPEEKQREQLAQVVDELKFLQDENGKLKTQAEGATLPEAPTSATAKVVDPTTQMEWLVTVRGYATGEMVTSLIANIQKAQRDLIGSGFVSFDTYVDQRKADRAAQNGNGAALPVSVVAPPKAASQPAAKQPEQFEASELVATINNGKAYWKVKGGKYTQYGVTVWPEVLQAAGFADDLDPMQTYSLNGYMATICFKDDGKVDKVTQLTR